LAELSGDADFEIRFGEALHNLRLALVRVRRTGLADLTDLDAKQAFANVADTMRTRSGGLIFDFRSPDPRVQMLGDALLAVATLHERGGKGMAKTEAIDLMRCLKYMEKQAATLEKQGRGATQYLDLICQAVSNDYLTREPDGVVRG